ncbi:hypothetical protein [Streptomyces sp.]|uniref:hypothetical protein n=1 Tax=Streptomyces sp. TaxID=1931 RepID=UPI002F3FDAE9
MGETEADDALFEGASADAAAGWAAASFLLSPEDKVSAAIPPMAEVISTNVTTAMTARRPRAVTRDAIALVIAPRGAESAALLGPSRAIARRTRSGLPVAAAVTERGGPSG